MGLMLPRRSREGAIAEALEGHMARLVGGEAGALLARCGLAEIAERVRCAAFLSLMAQSVHRSCCASASWEALRVCSCVHVVASCGVSFKLIRPQASGGEVEQGSTWSLQLGSPTVPLQQHLADAGVGWLAVSANVHVAGCTRRGRSWRKAR